MPAPAGSAVPDPASPPTNADSTLQQSARSGSVAQAEEASDATDAPALSDRDETTLYGSLPAGFWGDEDVAAAPLAGPRPSRQPAPETAPLYGEAPTRRESLPPAGPPAAEEPGQDETSATGKGSTGISLAELQELFPGRVLEVIRNPLPTGAEGTGDDVPPSDVDVDPDTEGYDDPDQAQLSFGPSE